MQITIGQAEIEQAIVAYVLQKVAINPDQNIDIEMKATRGEVGYQAFINISDSQTVRPVVAAPRLGVVGGTTTNKVPSTPAEVRAMMEAEAAAEEAEAAAEAQTPAQAEAPQEEEQAQIEETAAEVVQTAAVAAAPAVAVQRQVAAAMIQQPQVQTEQVAGATTPPPKKLFGGFSKPKN